MNTQKRLILCNLKELYSSFKQEYPDIKIGFSKFCSLRPKWCLLVGASGSHYVCVCTIHQNVNLMIDAMKINMTYQKLIDFVVCDRDNKECMIHRCKDCPGTEPLKQHIFQIMNVDDADGEELITFKQWTKTDRTELESLIYFIDLLIKK